MANTVHDSNQIIQAYHQSINISDLQLSSSIATLFLPHLFILFPLHLFPFFRHECINPFIFLNFEYKFEYNFNKFSIQGYQEIEMFDM